MTSLGRLRGLLAGAAIICGLLTPVAFAAPANAASVSCTGVSTIVHGGLSFEMPTIGNDTGRVDCVLGVGNHSAAVQILQDHLNACYWSGSSVQGHQPKFSTKLALDSDFGHKTEAALKAAQASVTNPSIDVDGVYGPETRRNINFFADDNRLGHCAKFGA